VLTTDAFFFSTVGISQKINPDDGQSPRICPRCNNGTPHFPPPHCPQSGAVCRGTETRASAADTGPRIHDFRIPSILTCVSSVAVLSAKKKTYFELFCVPVFPMSSKHVWVCGICQWRVPLQQGYALSRVLLLSYRISDTCCLA